MGKQKELLVVTISSWKQGNHYYVSFNGVQLKLNETGKWDLYSDVLTAIDKYMYKNHRKRPYEVKRKVLCFV